MRNARRFIGAGVGLAVGASFLTAAVPSVAAVAPPGQGFTVSPSDLAFILKQIKIAEAHVANTTSATGPCSALVGPGPNQLSTPLVSFGLRTVDGSCNNLTAGKARSGSADEVYPRLATPVFLPAESNPPMFGPPAPSSYAQKKGSVFDTEPRVVSNLVVDQTSTNPAAIAAAGFPVRTQGNPGIVVCTTDPDPLADPPVAPIPPECTPSHETLFIPNVTTDVGLSPPYNSVFTLFGQFFDHGIDQTVKGGGTAFVPLNSDDPLIAGPDHVLGNGDDLPANLRFMALTRGKNQPGPDGVVGDNPGTPADESADDVQDAANTDTPWVDQSQTYSSHASHQVFLREYVNNAAGRPVSTGKLLGGVLPVGAPADQDPGMATWANTKAQAASLLGLLLADKDVLDVPQILADAYGKFIPGPARGLPQYVTASGLVEGDVAAPVAVPADALHFDTPFLTDIANNAAPNPGLTPDADSTASADFANQPAGTYDDEMLDLHFIAGDGRVNENIGLTAIHQVFHSEHDRLVDDIENVLATDTSASGVAALTEWQAADGAAGWNGERLFQAARFITEMEYQHLVFEEFARKVQPGLDAFQPFAFTQTDLNPAIRAEFAHAVYRFGHSMLTETISRTNEDGSNNDISLLDGFLNPPSYTDGGSAGTLTSAEAAGSIIMGMSDQIGNELDEFVTDTLRNNLLGLPLDLASINMARARSEGVPPLNVFRRQLFAATNDGQLTPYSSWIDFGENIKHPESLINFVAAYGQHPTLLTDVGPDGELVDDPATVEDETADNGPDTLASRRAAAQRLVNPVLGEAHVPADAAAFMNSIDAWANTGTSSITGLDKVDLWVGGLAEMTTPFGGLLGTTFNFVFENQLLELQNGDRLYYLARTPGMNLRAQLEGNSFAEMMMRNTNVDTLKADAFATADCKFQLANLAGTPAGFAASGNTVADDPGSECNETALLLRQPDGTIQYRASNTIDPPGINGQAVYNGTAGTDRIRGGNDNDTFWGGPSRDVIEGGGGADVALGGAGDDIITDLAGDDVPKGGAGNDAIDSGPGLDIIMGGDGNDFTNGGANANETFGGAGNDVMLLGEGQDAAFGDSGDDWEEGGAQPDLMQGDSGNLFFLDDSQLPGSDVLIGQGGDDDYDMEGGNDIGAGGPGLEKVAGGSGYDWEIGQGDPLAQDLDLALPILPLDILQAGVRDRFNEVEALSGWKFDDTIRGDDLVPSAIGGGGFIGCDVLDQTGINQFGGLDALLPPLATPLASVVATSASRDCPILTGPNVWGDGNILLGGAGSDLIEGRGADDIIDGDAYLSVRLSVRTNANDPATEIGSAGIEGATQSAMTSQYLRDGAGALTGPTLLQAVFAGTVNPGNIVLVREILAGSGGTDTALFSGARAEYDVAFNADSITVTHSGGAAIDGTDTLRNIERLQFTDQTVSLTTPGAPTIGTATAGDASATVTFTAPTNPGGSAITGFLVEVSDGTTVVTTVPVPSATATSALVSGLTNGTSYTITVAAVNAIGTGARSGASNAVTPAAPVVPTTASAPLAVTAVAGNAAATVSWTAPANAATSAITGYRIRRYAGTTATVQSTTTVVASLTAVTLTGLTNGQLYSFDVTAVSGTVFGAVSTRSNAVTPGAPVTAPSAPVIGAATAGNATATVTWTAAATGGSPLTGYEVRVVDATDAQVGALRAAPAGTTSLVVTGLANAQAYRFQVQATNAVGTSPFSALSNAVTPTAPALGAPTVTNRTPAAGATGASTTRNIVATFSEPVTGVNATTYTLQVTATGAPVPATVFYNATTRGAGLNPNANLLAGTSYTATLTGGATAIRDTGGTPLVTTSWSFTTAGTAPTGAPTVTTRSPAAGATGVSTTGNVTATFSEPVAGVSGTTFTLTTAAGPVAATVTYDALTRVATVDPTPTLAAGTTVTATLTGGAAEIRDTGGTPLVTTSWTFTTAAAPAVGAPTVVARSPGVNATGASRINNITVRFSENVVGVSSTTFTLRNATTGTAIAGALSYNTTTFGAVLNPTATLAANTRYTVTLTGGVSAIRDTGGTAFVTTTWSFTTRN